MKLFLIFYLLLIINLELLAQKIIKTEMLFLQNISIKENKPLKNSGCLLKIVNLSKTNLLLRNFSSIKIEVEIKNKYQSIYVLEKRDIFYYSTDDPFVNIFENCTRIKKEDLSDLVIFSCDIKNDSLYFKEIDPQIQIVDVLLRENDVYYLYVPIPKSLRVNGYKYRAYYNNKFGEGDSRKFNKINETNKYIFYKFDGIIASDTVYFKL